jgi:hypothetical protein
MGQLCGTAILKPPNETRRHDVGTEGAGPGASAEARGEYVREWRILSKNGPPPVSSAPSDGAM